jgi:hypothetical protein
VKPTFFLCYDVVNDDDLRVLMFDEASQELFPMVCKAWSEEGIPPDIVRERIRSCDKFLVLCGELTHDPGNVDDEFRIAVEEGKPHRFLQGRKGRFCSPPPSADQSENFHEWSWETLEKFAAEG